jgi:uncharacterized protein YjdB
MLRVLIVGTMLTCIGVVLGQSIARLAQVTVTINPAKATLFAGETQAFVATVVGVDDKAVSWAVDEENGGTIRESGLYTAPKIQGVYHITAVSRGRPQTKGIATVTVLTYCDPFPLTPNR